MLQKNRVHDVSVRSNDTMSINAEMGSNMRLPNRPEGAPLSVKGFMRPMKVRVKCSMPTVLIIRETNTR